MAEVIRIGQSGYQVTDEEAATLDRFLSMSDSPSLVLALSKTEELRPDTGPLIHSALIGVMREVLFVGKDGVNVEQKYRFRGIDGVMNAVGPAARRWGVLAVPHKIDLKYRDTMTTGREPRPTREVTGVIIYRFYASDGSYLEAEVPGESLDQSDKGSAKMMSVALRIAWLQILTLPTQDPTTDDDGQYHTRAGTTGMSKFERTAGLALLAIPTDEQRAAAGLVLMHAALQQALDFATCIEEHAAWEAPVTEGAITWGELLAQRVADEIEHAGTVRDHATLWRMLKAAEYNPTLEGRNMASRMKDRAAAIVARNAETLNDLGEQIVSATQVVDLESRITAAISMAYADEHITESEARELTHMLHERSMKLQREATATPNPPIDGGDPWADPEPGNG